MSTNAVYTARLAWRCFQKKGEKGKKCHTVCVTATASTFVKGASSPWLDQMHVEAGCVS